MYTADAGGDAFNPAAGLASAARRRRCVAGTALDYVNSAVADLDGSACGELLIALGEVQAKLTAAHAAVLRRFDAANAHDADGYGSSSSWLAARAGMSKKGARAAVRQMRQLGESAAARRTRSAAGDITDSLAFTIADWTRKLPAPDARRDRPHPAGGRRGRGVRRRPGRHRRVRDRDVARTAARPDDPDPDDRVRAALAPRSAAPGCIRGDLTPECATAVRAVLEALGKKAGPEDDRTEGQRFHDALQLACTLLLRARLVPARAGADTQAVIHIPLSQLRQLPGAQDLEDAWIRARAGEDGYLTGTDAEAAACDAQTVPVVTGTMDPDVIDKMIGLARTAAEADSAARAQSPPAARRAPDMPTPAPRRCPPRPGRALRYAMARLAVDLVSGPAGVAAVLRQGLLDKPYNTPSLPLDIGYTDSIPAHIRRAVLLRDRDLRLAEVRPPGGLLRRASPAPQGRTAAKLRSRTAPWSASFTTTSASTAAAGSSSCTLTAPPRREVPTAGRSSDPTRPRHRSAA